ncbi:amino acid/polyamine/organocation transporter, APC superfamily (TC 2.A.3) [Geodermatophilus obscurus]|uniref:Amino acid/polyamine/organocation transporter, APC superfamily (TC 2.A.3) n=1 Tax=Geodermatophilus obscurus TaxID=1861 RepID=A0A1I5CCA8_9ACTN|nr:amino acid permease [Geodermatophilus obscurus]SFN84638.1 amino acid/polyamine/organocation transporter, APC superfamily (TC 2.A.3) [Geodermatophilus obscurus]
MRAQDDGDPQLAEFGYTQRLDRSIGRFASFAAGISYISILTGTFQLFYFGFGAGGPAYVWSWPMVFAGQLMVALCFAELAARYPVAGSLYNWTKRLGSTTTSWLAGWVMLTASVVTLAATALAYQITLPQLWSGFQVVGDGTGTYDVAVNAVLLGGLLILATTLVNAFGVRLMSRINSAGVFIELVAAVLIIVVLAVAVTRGPQDVLTDTGGRGEGQSLGYLGAFLVAALASGYVMYGFDTASSLGEETKDPGRTAPRAILRAVTASFVLGGLILLFALMAAPDLTDPQLSSSSGGLQYVLLSVAGTGLGKAFLVCIVVAVTVCVLAVQTATIRMAFAMARDNALPFSAQLARVDPKRRTPVVPAVVIGLLAIGVLVLNVRQPQVFTALTSIAVVMIYLAYLLVTGPMLVARLRGRWPLPERPGRFSLGRWGLPVNVLAVLWGAGMALNLAWPRREVYNATGEPQWYLQWAAFVFIGAIIASGLAWFLLRQRKRTGVLPEHAVVVDTAPPPTPA